MNHLAISGLPMIEEHEAVGEVAKLYEQGKRILEAPFVPNSAKVIATSPPILEAVMNLYEVFFQKLTLPQSLLAVISYAIPTAKNCLYCSANQELYCRVVGIDEATLAKVAQDLGNVSPERVKIVVEFALKCALEPQSLVAGDYDRVRDQGVSDEELIEIIFAAGLANLSDTMADATKIKVDDMVTQALGR